MTTYIDIEKSIADENNVHFIPCSVDYDGRAKVMTYFKEKQEADGVKTTSFRGRPLLGSEVKFPEGYCGYIVHKNHGCDKSRVFSARRSFKKINYWNLDHVPSKNDAIISALEWIDLSNAIHDRVTLEDIKKEKI